MLMLAKSEMILKSTFQHAREVKVVATYMFLFTLTFTHTLTPPSPHPQDSLLILDEHGLCMIVK